MAASQCERAGERERERECEGAASQQITIKAIMQDNKLTEIHLYVLQGICIDGARGRESESESESKSEG